MHQDTEGRWKTGPDIPSSSSRCSPCPLSSHCPQWVHLTIYESPHPLEAMTAGRCLSPACSVPDPCTCCVFFQGCFPRESRGSCVSPTTAAPLLFLQSTHHGLIVHVLYSFSVSPFYMVQSNVCFLGLHCTSKEWHLSKPLLIDEGEDSELFVSPLPWNVSPLNTAPIENDTGLAKKFTWVFCKMLWKNPKEFCGQPNK